MQIEIADMPLNETDKAWIREYVKGAHERHGWGKLAGAIKDWSGAGAAIAILILTVTQWTAYIEFRTNTQDRLMGIEKNLTQLGLQNHASLPQSLFETTLPDLKAVVSAARKENIKASPKVMEDLQSKLVSTSKNAPDFWPTVAEFISYRSLALSTPFTNTPSTRPWGYAYLVTLPNCTDSLPTESRITEVPNPNTAKIGPGVYENCRVTLDSEEENKRINAILSDRNPSLTFKHCLVVYHGGPINLILAWNNRPVRAIVEGKERSTGILSGNTLSFEDCLFEVSIQSVPPPAGQQFAETLLAQTGNTFTLPHP